MIAGQALYCFASLCAGICVMLAYDLLQVWRKIRHTGKWWVHIQDVIFWALASVGTFPVVLARNHGSLRIFFFLAFLAGALFYRSLAGDVVVDSLERFLRFFGDLWRKIVKKVLKIVSKAYIIKIRSKLRR